MYPAYIPPGHMPAQVQSVYCYESTLEQRAASITVAMWRTKIQNNIQGSCISMRYVGSNWWEGHLPNLGAQFLYVIQAFETQLIIEE